MDQNTTQRIQGLLSEHSSIGIVVGKDPSVDTMASALSLYLSLIASGKEAVSIACPTDPLVEVSSLVGIDRVKKQFQGDGSTLIVSFPYYGDNIEKGSYTVENGHLNIIVKAGKSGFSFEDRDVKYRREGTSGAPSLLFVVGTSKVSDLGPLFNPAAMKDTTIVNIDNKRENQGFGEVVLVSSEFASVSEQIVKLLQGLSLPIDLDIAQNLLDGIVSATGNLQDLAVSYQTLEAASLLMKNGAVRKQAVKTPLQTRKDPFGFDDLDLQSKPQTFPQRQKFPKQFGEMSQQQPFPRPSQQAQRQPAMEQSQPTSASVRPTFNQFNASKQDQSAPQQSAAQFPNAKQNVAQNDDQAPSDWLTPKIYKGSTNL